MENFSDSGNSDENLISDSSEVAGNKTSFTCKLCNKTFYTRQGLGGHASKKHPGASTSYNKKVQRRAERNNDRLVLQVAKAVMGID